jgi:hypothetical protein
MRTLALALAALIGLPALARAETSVDIHIGLPVVLPRLVVVSPGVQVVPEVDEEVFFTDGYYWVRRDDLWYRSRVHTGGWVVVRGRAVPARLVKIPPGHYKHWKPAKAEKAYRGDQGGGGDHGRGEGHGGKHKGGKGKH